MKTEFVPDNTVGGPGDKLHPNRMGYQAMGWRSISGCSACAPGESRREGPIASYCGTTPSRPTLMRFASSVPSGFLVAASTVNGAPALRSALLPIS